MSDRLSYEQKLPKNLPYAVRSEVNQRDNNEDSFQISQIVPIAGHEPITILAVADGMGGHAYGEVVSQEALKKVIGSLHEKLVIETSINRLEKPQVDNAQTLSKALKESLETANAHVKRMVEANKWGKAGSTIVMAAVLNDMAVVANLGDSPLFHYQANSKTLKKITEDHTVAGVLLRFKRITPEMARYHEGRNRLEFYVGCDELPEDDPIYPVNLAQGDMLLLCSDGVSASFSDEQIGKIFAEGGNDIEKIADALLKASLDAGETDNQTLIIWQHHLTGKTTTTSEPDHEKGGFKTLVQSSSNLTTEAIKEELAEAAASTKTVEQKSETKTTDKTTNGEEKENSEAAKAGESVNQSDSDSTNTAEPKQQEEEKKNSASVSSNDEVTEDKGSDQKEETSSKKSKKKGEESSKKNKKTAKKNEEKSKNDDEPSADLKASQPDKQEMNQTVKQESGDIAPDPEY